MALWRAGIYALFAVTIIALYHVTLPSYLSGTVQFWIGYNARNTVILRPRTMPSLTLKYREMAWDPVSHFESRHLVHKSDTGLFMFMKNWGTRVQRFTQHYSCWYQVPFGHMTSASTAMIKYQCLICRYTGHPVIIVLFNINHYSTN